MKENSPFKFLDAYQKEDYQVFFGREKETEKLYDALSGVKHLLVYGPTGAGKTSLIECGLRNQFSDADWFAISIRRGYNINASVFARIEEALEGNIEIYSNSKLPEDKNNLFGQAVQQLFEERFQPVYLLFDQFEELIILGNEEEQKAFFKNLNKLISYKIPCRILLIMREEFIGHLSEFENLCPTIFKHRFRLEKMRKDKVGVVIEQIIEAHAYQKFYELKDGKALAQTILSKLPNEKREIELTHVQVFLSELWDRARLQIHVNELPVLQPDLVTEEDKLKVVLNSFLKKQLIELGISYNTNIALEVLAAMISERHTKLQLSALAIEKDLESKTVLLKYKLSILLKDLERRRLIRAQKAGEQTQYEISHDLLALVVGQNLTEEMQMRQKANDVYRHYEEERQGLLSRVELNLLSNYELYKAYPKALKLKIKKSEVAIEEKSDLELKEAKDRAIKEKQLKDIAELNFQRAKKRTVIASFVALLALFSAFIAYYFFIEAKLQQHETEKLKEILLKAKEYQEKERKMVDSLYKITEKTLFDLQDQINLTKVKEQELQAEEKKRIEKEQKLKKAEIERIIKLAEDYMIFGGYDLAYTELKKALQLAPKNRKIKELINTCKSNLN